jgi:hypothetical protein
MSGNDRPDCSGQDVDIMLKEISVTKQVSVKKVWKSWKAAAGFAPNPSDVLAAAALDSNCGKFISEQANFTFVPMQVSREDAIRTKHANTTACGTQQLWFRFAREKRLILSTTLDSQCDYASKRLDAPVEFDLLLVEAHAQSNLICLCQFGLLYQQSGNMSSA